MSRKLTYQELMAKAKALEKELEEAKRELEQAREKNIESERLKLFYQFASFITHDLKNSTSTLSLVVKNCMGKIKDNTFLKRSFITIVHEVKKMRQLINKFSNFPLAPEHKFEKCNIVDLLENVLVRFEPLPNIEIIQNLSNLPTINVDNNALETVFFNVIKNSLEAMPEGGSLVITTKHIKAENSIKISISDTGLGISESYLNNGLFEPFSTTKDRGLGMGLYQSRDIVKRHEGEIKLKSELNRGTECIITLPISP